MAKSQRPLTCDTCGKASPKLKRAVLDSGYNALGKAPLWNCESCYSQKQESRHTADESVMDDSK